MSIETTQQEKCSSKELKILGDYWTLQIIQALSDGEKRFCELERLLPSANPVTLTSRLKKLEANHMVKRTTHTKNRLSVEYSLTEKGSGVLPILDQIKKFAHQYL